jgi:type I restriction enzyme R subunit
VQSVIEGLDILRERFRDRISKSLTEYLPSVTGKTADKAAEAALDFFRDEKKRQEFYGYFRELEDLYEILSPDPFLRQFVEDYQRLADLYALLRSAYDNQAITDHELARKTARLVQEHTEAGAIHEVVSVQEITPQTLEKIAHSGQSDTVKVFNLLKSINHKAQEEAGQAPYLFTIGERAEAIAEAFKQRQLSTQEALRQLEELINEINEAQREQAERGIPLSQADRVAGRMAAILKEYPHWHTSDEQSRQVRIGLYAVLEESSIPDIPVVVEKIMSVIRRS